MQGRTDRHPRVGSDGTGGSTLCAAHPEQRQMVRIRYGHRSMPERFYICPDYRSRNVVRDGFHQQLPLQIYPADQRKCHPTAVRTVFFPQQPDEECPCQQQEHEGFFSTQRRDGIPRHVLKPPYHHAHDGTVCTVRIHHPRPSYFGIIAGAMLWWYGLTWLVDKIRAVFDTNGIQIINKVVGSIVIIMSIIVLIGTVFNLYTLPSIGQ